MNGDRFGTYEHIDMWYAGIPIGKDQTERGREHGRRREREEEEEEGTRKRRRRRMREEEKRGRREGKRGGSTREVKNEANKERQQHNGTVMEVAKR